MNEERLQLRGPAGRLEAVLHEGPENRARALVAHPHPLFGGTMDNAVVRVVAGELASRGAAVLRFNFRGVGRSEGEHDRGRGERDDLRVALDALSQRFPEQPTWLAGYSFGAAAALRLLEDDPPSLEGILAIAPPIEHYDFSFLETAEIPIALLCGEQDELTPSSVIAHRTAAWPTLRAIEWIPAVGHDLGTASGRTGPLVEGLGLAADALDWR